MKKLLVLVLLSIGSSAFAADCDLAINSSGSFVLLRDGSAFSTPSKPGDFQTVVGQYNYVVSNGLCTASAPKHDCDVVMHSDGSYSPTFDGVDIMTTQVGAMDEAIQVRGYLFSNGLCKHRAASK